MDVAYGAAAALLISFAGLAVFWRSTRLEGGIAGRVVLRPGSLSRGLWVAGRAIGLALFVLLVGAADFGDPDTPRTSPRSSCTWPSGWG